MADEKKTYLINIESNLKKYADEAAEAKKKVDELKASNDELKKSGKEGTAEFEANKAALKNANDEYRKAQTLLKTQIAYNQSETGSRKQLSEQLKLQEQALGKLGNAYITNAEGQRELNPLYVEQRKQIAETKKAIIDYDLTLNDGRTNIGRYGESVNIAMKEAGKNIVSLFPSLRPVISGIESIQRSIKATGETATTSFKSIKVAIASTGIGLLVIAVTGLIALFAKLGLGKIMMDKFTDAIGLTTIAQDKLAEAQRISNEANIAGLNNEITLLKSKGASMDEIFQKELDKARATFETEKATLLAYASSKKNFDLAAKGGEQDLKLQEAKTAYFVLLNLQNKNRYDTEKGYVDQLSLLKKEGLEKDLEAIEQWYAAESAKYANSYTLFLLYEEKKKQAIDKDNERKAVEQAAIDLQILKDKATTDVEYLRSLLNVKKAEEIRVAGETGMAVAGIQKQYATAEVEIAKLTSDEKLGLASNFAGNIAIIFGENSEIGKAAAIAETTINTYAAATAAYKAMAGIPVVGPALGVVAAAAAVAAGIENVKRIMAVDVSGKSSPVPTSISSSAPAQRTFATPTGSTVLTQPQLTQTQLNAIPNQNLLTAEDIANALSKMPAPVVTVEDINVRTEAVNKITVRANI
jgi:hypothetical protein